MQSNAQHKSECKAFNKKTKKANDARHGKTVQDKGRQGPAQEGKMGRRAVGPRLTAEVTHSRNGMS